MLPSNYLFQCVFKRATDFHEVFLSRKEYLTKKITQSGTLASIL